MSRRIKWMGHGRKQVCDNCETDEGYGHRPATGPEGHDHD